MNKKILELATHSAMLIDIIDEINANTKIIKEINL